MIIHGDVMDVLKTAIVPNSIDVIFTSPNPVFYHYISTKKKMEQVSQEERDTIVGAETDNYGYCNHILHILDECQKVLKPRGSLFLQIADYHDSYGKDKTGSFRLVPELIALTAQRSGWFIQGKIIWHRPVDFKTAKQQTKGFVNDWEYVYHFTKRPFPEFEFNSSGNRYWAKSVWEVDWEKLIEICLKTTTPHSKDSIVLDPMAGGGTTGFVAKKMGFRYIMVDINKQNCQDMQIKLHDYGDIVPMTSVPIYIPFNTQDDSDVRTQ